MLKKRKMDCDNCNLPDGVYCEPVRKLMELLS